MVMMTMMMMIMRMMMMMILTSPSIMNPIPSLFFLNSALALTGFWSKFFSKLNYSVTRRQSGWLEAYDYLLTNIFKSGQFNDENEADMIGIVFQNLVPRQGAFCLASFGASSAHLWKVIFSHLFSSRSTSIQVGFFDIVMFLCHQGSGFLLSSSPHHHHHQHYHHVVIIINTVVACDNLWSWFLSIDKGKTVINLLDHRTRWFEVPDIVIIIIVTVIIIIDPSSSLLSSLSPSLSWSLS